MKAHADEQNIDNAEEYKNANQFEVERFLQCEFVSQIEGLTQKLWHFHPIQVVNNFKSSGFCSGLMNPDTI